MVLFLGEPPGKKSWTLDTTNNLTGLTGAYYDSVIICQHGGCFTGPRQFGVDAFFDAPLMPIVIGPSK